MDKSFLCSLTNITVNEKNFSLWKKEISKKCIKDDIPEILYNFGKTTNKDDIKFLKKDEYIDLVKSFIKKENEPKKSITPKKEKTKKAKECPEGKILNPKTGRCIKIKDVKTKPEKTEKPAKLTKPEKLILKNSHHGEKLCSSSDLTYTNYMRKRMKKYNNILQAMKKVDNNSCLTVFNDGNKIKYIINTKNPDLKILLSDHIGTPSTFGINYKSKFIEIEEKDNKYKEIPKLDYFVGKIQVKKQDTDVEIKILKFLTDQAIKRNLPHLPLLYKNIKCSNKDNINDLPKLLHSQHKSYLVTFNEFANGDLKSFLLSQDLSAEIWINAIEQIFMSIAIFHSFGMNHADTHYGNFLYHKIPSGGWFKYVINGNEYYVPNLGYYWIIWDFGVSFKLWNKTSYLLDYNLLTLYLRKYDDHEKRDPEFIKFELADRIYNDENGNKKIKKMFRQWGYIPDKINIPKSVEKIVDDLYRASGGYGVYSKNQLNGYYSEDVFFENLKKNNILFNHKYDDGEILSNAIIKLASYKNSKDDMIRLSDLDVYYEIKYKGK